MVVGTTGSGKTTLARRLATILGTQCFELDALYWGPAWSRRADFQQDVLAAAQQPRWVIDGNYSAVRDIIWRRCTAIVWLDYSFARVFSRALRRTVHRVVTGERLFSGNRETIRNQLFDAEGVLWWVVRTHGKRRREFPELFRRPEYAHVTVIQLPTPAVAEALLTEARAHADAWRVANPARAGADGNGPREFPGDGLVSSGSGAAGEGSELNRARSPAEVRHDPHTPL